MGQELGELLLASRCDLLLTGMLHGFEDYAEVPPIDEDGTEAETARELLRWALAGTPRTGIASTYHRADCSRRLTSTSSPPPHAICSWVPTGMSLSDTEVPSLPSQVAEFFELSGAFTFLLQRGVVPAPIQPDANSLAEPMRLARSLLPARASWENEDGSWQPGGS